MEIKCLENAHEQIDRAIAAALREQKPVYINIACNLGAMEHPSFSSSPIPLAINPKVCRSCLDLINQFVGTSGGAY